MGGTGEEEIVIMYHYIEDKVFLKEIMYNKLRKLENA